MDNPIKRLAIALVGRYAKAAWIVPTWARGKPQYTPTNVQAFIREGYKRNELIYSCVRVLAESASEAYPVVHKITGAGETEPSRDHPLQALLDEPNDSTTCFEMHEAILTDMNVAGESFVYKERSRARRVVGLWRLEPDKVAPIPGERGIDGWEYGYGAFGNSERYEADDVIWFPFFDPGNSFHGLSPMEVASRVKDIDNKLTDYVGNFFDQGAMIPGYLKYLAGTLTKKQKEDLRKRFSEIYGGHDQWAAPAVFDMDLDFVRTGMTYKEMEFGDLRSTMEIRTCMVYGVPPILLPTKFGLDAATYSNYGLARKSLWEDTLSPLYRRMQDRWNKGLIHEYARLSVLRLLYDYSKVKALQEDVNKAWDRATEALKAGGLTVNMFLEEIGKPQVQGGDVFLRPLTMAEIPAIPEKKAFVLNGVEYKVLPDPEHEKKQKLLGFSKAMDLTARAWEGLFKQKALEIFQQEGSDILKLLKREGKGAKQGAPFQGFMLAAQEYYAKAGGTWKNSYLPVFESLLVAQGENIASSFGISFDLLNPETIRFLESYTMRFSDKVVQTSWHDVRDTVIEAQKGGWTVPEIRAALQNNFKGYPIRAETIARTETMRSSNAGAVEAYRQSGVRTITWLDGQESACGWCQELHGTTIAIEQVWFTEGEVWELEGVGKMVMNYGDVGYPPLHPKCRCTVAPVLEEVGQKPPEAPGALTAAAARRLLLEEEKAFQARVLMQRQLAEYHAVWLDSHFIDQAGKEVWMAHAERYREAMEELWRLADEVRAALRQHLMVTDAASWKVKTYYPPLVGDVRHLNPDEVRFITEALDELQGLVSKGAQGQFDAVWIRGTTAVRSYHGTGMEVAFGTGARGPRTVAHELGHWLEASNPDIAKAAQAFLDKRTKGESAIWLGDRYDKSELSKFDRWIHPYMGKIYPGGETEIMSMGLEYFYSDPIALARGDPEMFDFVFNTLRGVGI